ncbi:hypothetical protein ACFV0R_33030 [Streptomyces sp. NPDC059578]|uniref:hypothetical protein n=1 Tax=unclassified Streptomyces TaxID=2593676 RepID=UPI00364B0D14
MSDLLAEWAKGESTADRAAVSALAADDDLITRDSVRNSLAVKRNGQMICDWPRLSRRHSLLNQLSESDAVFLAFVLAIAQRTALPLRQIAALGERRLTIVLRALATLAGSDTVAVGVRT